MATTPHILDVYPAPGASGIPIGDQITVTFDQEMDETSINTGTFVLAAPDRSTTIGEGWNFPDTAGSEDEDMLSSPYYGGFVKGTISFSRVNSYGSPVEDSETDTTGDGTLWRTVALFTPSQPLSPNVQYTVLVAGDEDPTNQFDSGVRTRTVFDPVAVSVTGTGNISFSGGYTGSASKTYTVEIVTAGTVGNATYQWWDNSDPLTVYQGITSTGNRELDNGLLVSFDPDGTLASGDKWTVYCTPFISLLNTYKWTFTTGSGEILTPPSSSSASGIGDISATATSASTFSVSEVSPEGGKYGVSISQDPYQGEIITVTFTDTYAVDATTLVDAVDVRMEAANGDENLVPTTDLDFETTLSGSVLTITLDPGQLVQNAIVIVTLDKTIADTEGNTLGSEYITYFSTTYTPLYSSLRRIRFDLGNLIVDIQDETIMLAILEASILADSITFSTTITNSSFYQQAKREFVTCLAELKLLRALYVDGSLGDRVSKQLGDLSVSRSGVGSAIKDRMNEVQDCINYWRIVLESGGAVSPNTSLSPEYSVKGANADDAITVARQWEPTNGYGSYRSAANAKVSNYNSSSRRQYRTFRNKSSWRTED